MVLGNDNPGAPLADELSLLETRRGHRARVGDLLRLADEAVVDVDGLGRGRFQAVADAAERTALGRGLDVFQARGPRDFTLDGGCELVPVTSADDAAADLGILVKGVLLAVHLHRSLGAFISVDLDLDALERQSVPAGVDEEGFVGDAPNGDDLLAKRQVLLEANDNGAVGGSGDGLGEGSRERREPRDNDDRGGLHDKRS